MYAKGKHKKLKARIVSHPFSLLTTSIIIVTHFSPHVWIEICSQQRRKPLRGEQHKPSELKKGRSRLVIRLWKCILLYGSLWCLSSLEKGAGKQQQCSSRKMPLWRQCSTLNGPRYTRAVNDWINKLICVPCQDLFLDNMASRTGD